MSGTCYRSVVFSGYYGFPPTNKTDRHDITEILLKGALNTINLTKPNPPKSREHSLSAAWEHAEQPCVLSPGNRHGYTFISKLSTSHPVDSIWT